MISLVGVGAIRFMPYLRATDCHLCDSEREALIFSRSLDVRAIVHVQVGEVDALSVDSTVVPPVFVIQRRVVANVGHREASRFRDAIAQAYLRIAQHELSTVCSRCPAWTAAVTRTFSVGFCTVTELRRVLRECLPGHRCALNTGDARMLVTAPVILGISARARIGCSLSMAIQESGVSERTFRRWHPIVQQDTGQPFATMRPRRLIAAWSVEIFQAMSSAAHSCEFRRGSDQLASTYGRDLSLR